MIKYSGVSYNLDCLIQFQVLKQFLEALAKRQLEHDSIIYGSNHVEIENNINENQNNNVENITKEDKNTNKENIKKKVSNNNIMDIIDEYGIKEGIKKNNELISKLFLKIKDLENKDTFKKDIKKSIDTINEENKKKFNYYEQKINELNKKVEKLKGNTENYLNIIDNNRNDLLELITKNQKDIKKNKDAIEQLKKSINEYINSKINQMKYNLNEEISKKFDEFNSNIKKNTERNMDFLIEKIDNINKSIKEHDTKLYSIEENQNKAIQELNGNLNTFKGDQKKSNSKFRQDITSIKLLCENYNQNFLRINEILDNNNFKNLLTDINAFSSKIVDLDEYKKTIDLINTHLNALQSDNNQYRRYFEEIMPLIGKITTSEDLKKLEQLLRDLLEQQDINAKKKYMDKAEVLKNIKNIMTKIKTLMSGYDKERENPDNCMLASKPLNGYKCVSCEAYIGDLRNSTQYIPWNKFHIQDMILKPYRIGNGFSHFLQNINLENPNKNNSFREEDEKANNKNNNININNNSSIDKSKNNKSIFPSVSLKNSPIMNNIIEIKPPQLNADDNNINLKVNNKYYNSYFTRTEYSTNGFMVHKNKSNCLLTKRNKKNIILSQSNNNYGNCKTISNSKDKDKVKDDNKIIEKNSSVKYLNIQKINNIEKDFVESPIKPVEKKKKENFKKIYDNLK